MSLATVVIACHLYKKDSEEFKLLCRGQSQFHSEVLRDLILSYIQYVKQGWKLTDQGWVKPQDGEKSELERLEDWLEKSKEGNDEDQDKRKSMIVITE